MRSMLLRRYAMLAMPCHACRHFRAADATLFAAMRFFFAIMLQGAPCIMLLRYAFSLRYT